MRAFRIVIIAAAATLSACAANPVAPDRAPIDYRSMGPAVRSTSVQSVRPSAPPAVPPRIVEMGVSPTDTSSIDEAKALAPQAGPRPGGALRQPRDSKSDRAVTVRRGDTLYEISQRYSVNMRALIETNRLSPPYALDAGEVIYLPPPNVHVVERGETLYSVSRRYNVDTRSLALLNAMSRPWTIWPGDELVLPPLARDQGREQTPATVSAAPPPISKPPVPKPASSLPKDKAVSLTSAAPKIDPPRAPAGETLETPAGAHDFIWPVSGPVLRGFGAGPDGVRNDGVNIAAPEGAEVRASADGEVVYAGDELVGFGNLILIRHAGGWVSAYAHSEKLLVKEGDSVRQGQPIASAGASANASAPQVHFELRKGREPVDPAEYLPALRG